jgi:hypothetical protein
MAEERHNLSKRIEVEYEGKRVPAEQLEFTAKIPEPWALYELEDGTQVKIKTVLAQVFRIVDAHLPNGDPVYGIQVGTFPAFTYASNLSQPITVEKEQKP